MAPRGARGTRLGLNVTPPGFTRGMAVQLTLLDPPRTWRLNEATRALGRKGVAEARASLRAALAAPHTESDRDSAHEAA